MPNQSVGFFLNVEKLFGSMTFQRMSFTEKGVYLTMLCQQWREGARNLPDDPHAVADLIAVTPQQSADVVAAWDVVRRKFVTADRSSGRIWNVELERTRKKQRAFYQKRVTAARRGGNASAAKRLSGKVLVVNDRSTVVEPPSTDQIRTDKRRTDQIREEEQAPTARSKRPIFTGQKLTVFEWMLDDCLRTLGSFADAFDLHEWFFALDAQALEANLVIPKRDGGAWLQAQLVAEAQRRGLPLQIATAAPQHKRVAAALAGGQAFLNRQKGS